MCCLSGVALVACIEAYVWWQTFYREASNGVGVRDLHRRSVEVEMEMFHDTCDVGAACHKSRAGTAAGVAEGVFDSVPDVRCTLAVYLRTRLYAQHLVTDGNRSLRSWLKNFPQVSSFFIRI